MAFLLYFYLFCKTRRHRIITSVCTYLQLSFYPGRLAIAFTSRAEVREEPIALRTGQAREKVLRNPAFINRKHKDLEQGLANFSVKL